MIQIRTSLFLLNGVLHISQNGDKSFYTEDYDVTLDFSNNPRLSILESEGNSHKLVTEDSTFDSRCHVFWCNSTTIKFYDVSAFLKVLSLPSLDEPYLTLKVL